VVIENRGGAGGGVGAAEAARAAPDGYTLFFPSGSVVTANQHIYSKLNYDPERDFVPITNVVSGPQVVAVPAASPYKSVKDLVAALRANPGKLTYGHAGIGSQTHLAASSRPPVRQRRSSTRSTATRRRRSKRATCGRASTCRALRRWAIPPPRWARR
jgi:hypothetical protein